jgi:phosphate transport system substrate-binding protein
MKHLKLGLIVFVLSGLLASSAFADVSLKGTGSFLAAPLLGKWIEGYHHLHPEVKIKYEIKTSSDGINQWLGRGAEFSMTDTPLTPQEEKKILGRAAFHLPVALEAVAITYNLPGISTGLRFSPKVLSSVFIGTLKKWNDPALKELNPGVHLPDMDILVLHRQEESSLHDLFPSWIGKIDSKWTLKREKDKNLHWPVGQNLKGNEKVYEKMRKWPGVIAAVDFPYALQNHLPLAEIRNGAGVFVAPSPESIQASASDLVSLPDDFKVSLSSSRVKEAYPLCTFSWLLVYQDTFKAYHDHKRGTAVVEFLKWIYSDGQKVAADASYVPLPETYLPQAKQAVESITY